MSKETLQHLNTNTLIGFTEQRGHAWHYRAEEQGDEPNYYPGAIPLEDVRRRLFGWMAESRRVAVELPADVESMTHLDDSGEPMRWAVAEYRQGICRSDTGAVMGIFSEGYSSPLTNWSWPASQSMIAVIDRHTPQLACPALGRCRAPRDRSGQ